MYINNHGGEVGKEAAISVIESWIEIQRRELLSLVLEGKKSVLPKPCKELFRHISFVLHQFYSEDDGFQLQGLIQMVNEIIQQPILLKDQKI